MYNLTEQQNAALNHGRHISLTANAGSGKTFVLAKRFLSILIEEDVDINNIVAITFTEKAARELYKRIANEIESSIEQSNESKLVRKLEGLRKRLISSKISTIHSFCTEILKEFPTEAKIDANFIPIDQRISNELIQSSVDEVIQNSIRKNDELINLVKKNIRLFGSKKMLHSALVKMIAQRDSVNKINKNIYSRGKEATAIYFRDKFEAYFSEIFADNVFMFYESIRVINNRVKESKPENEIASRVDILLKTSLNEKNIFGSITIIKNIFQEVFIKKGSVKDKGYLSGKNRNGIHSHIEFVESFNNEFKIIEYSEDYFDLLIFVCRI